MLTTLVLWALQKPRVYDYDTKVIIPIMYQSKWTCFSVSKARSTSTDVYEKDEKLTEKERQLVEKEAEV